MHRYKVPLANIVYKNNEIITQKTTPISGLIKVI